MRKKSLSPRLFIIMTVVLIFLWLPVFMNYYGLMEADFLASDQNFENTDLEIYPIGHKSQFLLLISMAFLIPDLVGFLFDPHLHLNLINLLRPDSYRLRC